jgi:hypothetical protein
MLISAALIPMVLPKQSEELVGWSTTTALATINICMIWRIGIHLRALSWETSNEKHGATAINMVSHASATVASTNVNLADDAPHANS